jgi:hypothetical protein
MWALNFLIRAVNAGTYIPPAAERVHTLHAWLVKHLMQRVAEGGLGIPADAPTQARMHAVLTDAMHGYEQAKYGFSFSCYDVLLLHAHSACIWSHKCTVHAYCHTGERCVHVVILNPLRAA